MRFLASLVKVSNHAKLDLTGEGIVAPKWALPEAAFGGEAPLMEAKACREYAKEMRNRYRKAVRAERGRLLDEFTAAVFEDANARAAPEARTVRCSSRVLIRCGRRDALTLLQLTDLHACAASWVRRRRIRSERDEGTFTSTLA